MAVITQGIQFSEAESVQVVLLDGSPLVPVDAQLVALEFEEHGIRVERHEPDGTDYVRHVHFLPYSSVKRVSQSYTVEGA